MTETTASADATAQQKTTAAFFGSVLNSGTDPLLKAQADILSSVETTVTDWLHRRQEAVAETQNLVARLSTSSDPAELLKLQQEWVSGAIRRLSADAAAYQTATQQLVERARGWFPQATEIADNIAANTAAATRAAGKSLRVAKAGE
jgi:hypothetical protein